MCATLFHYTDTRKMLKCLVNFLALTIPLISLLAWAKPAEHARASNPASTAQAKQGANVILVTLDGVRWNEFFEGPDPALAAGDQAATFPNFWSQLAAQGAVFGDTRKNGSFAVANPKILSLPAYHNIMAGALRYCRDNNCGRISVETLPERLARELDLPFGKVAVISSWHKIALAAQSQPNKIFVNAGLTPLADPTAPQINDPELDRLNTEQAAQSLNGARFDRFTWAQAMRYLKRHEPRFLWISLNDADEWGHQGQYPAYLATLRWYDYWLRELVATLEKMGDYSSRATIVMTTDHGRGNGREWKKHGGVSSAKRIWLYAKGPGITPVQDEHQNTHSNIRATIEALFGLAPCARCAAPMNPIALPANKSP